jgi:hypothetical protein
MVSVEKSAVIFMGLPLYVIFFSLTAFQYSFSVLCAICFNDSMPWRCSILVKSVWCPGYFFYLNEQLFLNIWGIFLLFFEHVIYPFHLVSFNAQDSQVWTFDGVTEFLHIPFAALESFV